MSTNAKEQIEYINQSLEWIKKHRQADYENKFLCLVEKRRELRKMAEAERDNPAIAAYGISQVGKSYLMNNMLQQTVIENVDGKEIKKILPFEVETPSGRVTFIKDINPKTISREATGVITRFSSFSKEPDKYSREYPVLLRCLSIADITLVLCDAYFKDTCDYKTDNLEVINAKAQELYNRYISRQPLPFTPVVADDILDMKAYFKAELNEATNFNDSEYFTKLAVVIDRIPVEDYPEIFAYLWHNATYPDNDQYINSLYVRLLNVYKRLEYKKDVYLPIDAVLNKEIGGDKIENERTIMSVECLNGLGTSNYAYKSEAYIKNSDGSFKSIGTINKSELAAVCAEVVFYINECFLNNKASYSIKDSITDPEVKAILEGKGELKYDFLKTTDLLDFPGARSRENKEGASLQKANLLVALLLRGKVAYLFNKYSEAKNINILLYCHHQAQENVTFISIILKKWIHKYIGATTNERAKTLADTGGISPFFYIATKFNGDLEKVPTGQERSAIDIRWKDRFISNLREGLFQAEAVDWVNNYTGEGQKFQNSYLLRDYQWSSNLYTGFKATGCETGYFVDPNKEKSFDEDYRKLLRDSFTESEDVKKLFKNPALSWDVATTMNNDGALYIIENIANAASKIVDVRNRQFRDKCTEIAKSVLKEIANYYIPENDGLRIQQKKGICKEIHFDLLKVCDVVPIFFGLLLESFQLSTEECEKHISNDVIPNWDKYFEEMNQYALFRLNYHFEAGDDEVTKLEKIKKYGGFSARKAAEDWFSARHVSFTELLSSNAVSVSKSMIVANCVFKYWIEKISKKSNLNVLNKELDSANYNNIRDCLIKTASHLNLSDIIGDSISEINGMGDKMDDKIRRIADIAATIINNFVIDFGYDYLNNTEKAKIREIFKDDVKETELIGSIDAEIEELHKKCNNVEMTKFLNEVLEDDSKFQKPWWNLFNKWCGSMLMASMASIGVLEYDRVENAEIEPIVKGLETSIG